MGAVPNRWMELGILAASRAAMGAQSQVVGALALLPPLAGWARDATGAPAAPLLAGVAFLLVALAALAVYLRLVPRNPA